MTIELSPKQAAASDAVVNWFRGDREEDPKTKHDFFYLAGYAGTGKTSIAKQLVERLEKEHEEHDHRFRKAFAAFTGKASLVLERKGCSPASTVHGLIYKLDREEKGQLKFRRVDYDEVNGILDLIILDECSMINGEMAGDLLFYDVPILVLGDPGQLPPVDGEGFFTAGEPDFFLDEIHRQAEGSAIIQWATRIRQGERLRGGSYNDGEVIITGARHNTEALIGFDQILCGTHRLRHSLNGRIRQHLGFKSDLPLPSDKLICLRNNWNITGMMNGSLWELLKPPKPVPEDDDNGPNRIELTLRDWDNKDAPEVVVKTHKCFFDRDIPPPEGREWRGITQFTYGYAITVHKSQGSQWDRVCIFDESGVFREDAAKHLYTAITRAAKHATILI